MALKKDIVLTGTADVTLSGQAFKLPGMTHVLRDCYIKVARLSGHKGEVTAHVEITNPEGAFIEYGYGFIPDLNGDNFFKQAYLYLKTRPEYSDAEDC